MGVELHCLTDNVGTFGAVSSQKPHFVHSVQKLSVGRLETVNLRDCTGYDYAHCVGHIILFKSLCNALGHHNKLFFIHVIPSELQRNCTYVISIS